MGVSCFDITSAVIEEANKKFAPIWSKDEEKYNILKDYCDAIDKLSEEFDGISFEVEVDEITMNISITLECVSVAVCSPDHVLCRLIERSSAFGFSSTEDATLLIKFTFPSIWDKTI